MKYTLIKALTSHAVSKSGKVATPIIGYVLLNNETNQKEVFNKYDAYSLVIAHKATNAEAKIREDVIDGEEKVIYYLKPNDGTKINDYLLSID